MERWVLKIKNKLSEAVITVIQYTLSCVFESWCKRNIGYLHYWFSFILEVDIPIFAVCFMLDELHWTNMKEIYRLRHMSEFILLLNSDR